MAAFGYMAGFCGAALGLEAWCQQQLSPAVPYPSVLPYKDVDELIAHMKTRIADASGTSIPVSLFPLGVVSCPGI